MQQNKCSKTSLTSQKTNNAVLKLKMRVDRGRKTADAIIYAAANDEVDLRDAHRYWNGILRQDQ